MSSQGQHFSKLVYLLCGAISWDWEMLTKVRKSLMSSSESTFDAKFSPNIIPRRNFWYTLSFLGTNGCGRHYWNSWGVRLLEFFWSYLTMRIILKITTVMSSGSFQDVLELHVDWVPLLCNANQSMSLPPSISPWVHNSRVNHSQVNLPAFAPTIMSPWRPLLLSSQWCLV